ncbi:hypothetical protein [Xylocopilactobacillus apicola]|uniref:Uncharacterized protein n=1 Tax=Xylocopilactobacillus apicola TaxID=2932184 RepID=A0AAU9DA69_9LACO|nr:hypothetical protein [Xylocopilactobacillus apicola]BDR59336.1 hypothetical protein XA3_17770 [Xylocopilactobacillus apicola]
MEYDQYTDYKVITDKKRIDSLMWTYLGAIEGRIVRAMKWFAQKEGYGEEVVGITFMKDLDEEDVENLPKPLDDHHVLVELTYPAVDVNEMAYVDFETFFEYLTEEIQDILSEHPDRADLLLPLLGEVKKSLGV